MFGKAFRFIRAVLIISLLILIVMFGIGRLRGASAEQQQALDLLAEKPAFKAEENLAPYLWLFEYDVPATKITEIFNTDAKKFNALTNSDDIANFKTQADGHYKKINYHKDELEAYCCAGGEKKLLAQVERDQQKLKPLLKESRDAISRAERVLDYRLHYSPMEMHMEGPIPTFNAGRTLLRVHYADLFINGQQQLALEKVCGDIVAWRSIGANSDNLIGAMVGHAFVRQDMEMLAEMLARMKQAEILPDSCTFALAPTSYEENMICHAMQGEFGMQQNLAVSLNSSTDGVDKSERYIKKALLKIGYDNDTTLRRMAPLYASACNENAVTIARRNENLILDFESNKERHCDAFDWVSNGIGCFLIDVATPDMKKYPGRRLDQSAQITAMQTLLWLRDKKVTAENIEKTFLGRPENLKAFSDRIHLNIKNGTIEVDLLSPASDKKKTWELPLLRSMLVKTAQ